MTGASPYRMVLCMWMTERSWFLLVLLVALGGIISLSMLKVADMQDVTPVRLSEDEKSYLLRLAREALEAELSGRPAPAVPPERITPGIAREAACFVTLTEEGRLRGCILDSFIPHEPIYRNVMRNVILAATADPRFPPVTPQELPLLTIEISVLGRPRTLEFDGPEDLLAKLRPGIDGVILTTRYGTSTYLPQVWEQLPDPEVFLTELCRKHGAPGDCWKNGESLKVEVYEVEHFSEEDTRSD